MKPFLRWAGSKRQLVKKLGLYWPDDAVKYVEPFAGSACLFFHLEPSESILGDVNKDLINCYQCVKKDPKRLYSYIDTYNKEGDKEEFYKVRSEYPHYKSKYERAAAFIYLNRFCFNGLYRTNRKGVFNVPYGGGKTGSLITKEELCEVSKRLRNVRLHCGDFGDVCNFSEEKVFYYIDPPYAVKNERIFSQYDPSGFGVDDLKRLRAVLEEIDRSGGYFLMSYAECDEVNEIFCGWSKRVVTTKRNIAGFTSKRKMAEEVFITNLTAVGV